MDYLFHSAKGGMVVTAQARILNASNGALHTLGGSGNHDIDVIYRELDDDHAKAP